MQTSIPSLKKDVLKSTSSKEDAKLADMPPFYLETDEFIPIFINSVHVDPLKIVLEFLYTDRIVSLEGKGKLIEIFDITYDNNTNCMQLTGSKQHLLI